MPRISDARRSARRAQILHAAWTCFDRGGLQGTTIEDIIRVSGLSAGAVYSYFPSKDDLVVEAATASLSDLAAALQPLLSRTPAPNPAAFVTEALTLVAIFAKRDAFDLLRIAVHGWSEAQRNPRVLAAVQGAYLAMRARVVEIAERWRAAGVVDPKADPDEVAKALFDVLLGFVAQSAILGDAPPDATGRGFAALFRA